MVFFLQKGGVALPRAKVPIGFCVGSEWFRETFELRMDVKTCPAAGGRKMALDEKNGKIFPQESLQQNGQCYFVPMGFGNPLDFLGCELQTVVGQNYFQASDRIWCLQKQKTQ